MLIFFAGALVAYLYWPREEHFVACDKFIPSKKMKKASTANTRKFIDCLKTQIADLTAGATLRAAKDFRIAFRKIVIDGTPLATMYSSVLASDGFLYYMVNPVDQNMLAVLMECHSRLLKLVNEVVKRYPESPMTQNLLRMMRKCGYVCNIIQKHDKDNPTAGAHSLRSEYLHWFAMSKGWSAENGGDVQINFGSVVHEISHAVCAEGDSCLAHGAGWCRTQATLLQIASDLGLWKTNNTAWGARLPDMQRASYVTPPGEEGLALCDTGNLFT